MGELVRLGGEPLCMPLRELVGLALKVGVAEQLLVPVRVRVGEGAEEGVEEGVEGAVAGAVRVALTLAPSVTEGVGVAVEVGVTELVTLEEGL